MAEPAGSALSWPDFAILAASLAFLVAIGVAFSREQRGTADFFLARRRPRPSTASARSQVPPASTPTVQLRVISAILPRHPESSTLNSPLAATFHKL